MLLIACANLANLMLARASAREREIAIRLGLGASRGRVVRQLLTESIVLSAAGAMCGFLLARVFSDALVLFVDGGEDEIVLNLATDWRVVAFTAGLGALTCLLFGLVPAIRATGVGVATVMKNTGRGLTGTRESSALRRTVVVAQVAISVVLLFGALLFARTLHNLGAVDTGFARGGVVITDVDFSRVAVAADKRGAYRQAIVDRLRAAHAGSRAPHGDAVGVLRLDCRRTRGHRPLRTHRVHGHTAHQRDRRAHGAGSVEQQYRVDGGA